MQDILLLLIEQATNSPEFEKPFLRTALAKLNLSVTKRNLQLVLSLNLVKSRQTLTEYDNIMAFALGISHHANM